MPIVTDHTDPETWAHLCALHLQELSPTYSNARADAIATGLRDTWPALTPVEAAAEFLRPWGADAEAANMPAFRIVEERP